MTNQAKYTNVLSNIIKKKSILPKGYKQVEYLESTGTQYIDTNQIVLLTTKVIVHNWQRIKRYSYYQVYIGGGVADNSPDDFRFMEWGTSDCIDYTNGKGQHIGKNIFSQQKANIIEMKGNTINIDGHKYSINITNCTDGIKSVWLFASSTPNLTRGSACRMGIIEFINDNKHSAYFIPCLDNNNIPCMYDLVSKQTFYNQGAGEDFLYGPIINGGGLKLLTLWSKVLQLFSFLRKEAK